MVWDGTDSRVPYFEAQSPQIQASATTSVPNNADTNMRWTVTNTTDATGAITNPNVAATQDGRIVLGQTGVYRVDVRMTQGNGTVGIRVLKLLLNGSAEIEVDSKVFAAAGGVSLALNLTRPFTAGDYLLTQAFQNNGGALALFSSGYQYAHIQVMRIA